MTLTAMRLVLGGLPVLAPKRRSPRACIHRLGETEERSHQGSVDRLQAALAAQLGDRSLRRR